MIRKVKKAMQQQHLYKTSSGSQKIELPADQNQKEKLMRYHGVSNDYDLKLALYREILKKNRNSKS